MNSFRVWGRALVLVFVSVVALGVTTPAQAQGGKDDSGKDDARRFFKAGQKAFAAGRYEEAARAFEEAFRIAPHPAPLINAGDAYEKSGDLAMAARAYQRVLDLEQSGEQDRQDATDRLARLSPKLAIIQLTGDETARVRVDEDEFTGAQRVYVVPGEHDVTLVDVDGAKSRRVEVAAGSTRTVDVGTLMPKASTGAGGSMDGGTDTSEPAKDGGKTKKGGIRAPTWIAFGLAAVGAGGAVYFGLQVNDAEKSFNESPNQDDYDRFNKNKLFTNVGIGVAVVGAGVGTYLLIKDLGRKPDKKTSYRRALPVTVDAVPMHGGGMLLGSGSF